MATEKNLYQLYHNPECATVYDTYTHWVRFRPVLPSQELIMLLADSNHLNEMLCSFTKRRAQQEIVNDQTLSTNHYERQTSFASGSTTVGKQRIVRHISKKISASTALN